MAKWGLSGKPVPLHYPYADATNRAAFATDSAPCALYAIGWRETIGAEVSGWLEATFGCTAANVISPDGGKGIWQLTYSAPANWADPYTNAKYASEDFYNPYLMDWIARGYSGPTLLRLAADDFNAGDRRTLLWHNLGNADGATTGGNYGTDVAIVFQNLINGRPINQGRP